MSRRFARLLAKLRNLLTRGASDASFDHEIRTHLAFFEDDFLRQGLSPAEAHRQALLAVGSVEGTRQAQRDARSFLWFVQAGQDLRHALRSMRRAPAFAVVAILTLALGIGANTAVFSVLDAVLLRPLPYPDPDRIVQFFLISRGGGSARGASIPDLRFWRDHATAVENIAAFDFAQSEMGLTSGFPEQIHGLHVTSGYFTLFGAPMLLGRSMSSDDDRAQGPRVVVLSYDLWSRRFARDPHIIGREISLDKQPYAVIGVTGPEFRPEPAAQLWIPFHFDLNSNDPAHSFGVAARLKPGISLAEANEELHAVADAARRTAEQPDPDFHFQLRRLRDAMVSEVQSSLLVLQGAVLLVLLIACANLANLFLVRTTVRAREFAIRAAIGAGRGRLFRQLIAESLLLCAFGCIAGTALGPCAVRLLLRATPGDLQRIGETSTVPGLHLRVLAFAVLLSCLTGVLFSVFPALIACRKRITHALHGNGSRQSAGIRTRRSQSIVVAGEIAMSLILLIAAALLLRTFFALNRVDPGFDGRNVVVMTMPIDDGPADASATLVRDAGAQLTALPGIENFAATFSPPFASRMGLPFASVSAASPISGDGEWQAVSPTYFAVLRIPILRGRAFDTRDSAAAPPVVLINETMARRFWPHQDPIGQVIVIGKNLGPVFDDTPRRILGIVADTRDNALGQAPEPTMILPLAQQPAGITKFEARFGPLTWLIRTRSAPGSLVPAIAGLLRKASGGRPVGSARVMDEILSRSLARQRFNMLLLSVFASIALLLAAIGIYGVMAYSVAQRTQEIGVRMALGADRATVGAMILREGALTGILGVSAGVGGAFFLVRLLAGLLYGVSMRDPAVFLAAAIILELVTILAAWIPAHRAAHLDPIRALRFE
ncbi:MAG TPA: ABC transporter permease [Terracidiphilus sp.]